MPPDADLEVVGNKQVFAAVKAVARGDATPEQQSRAIKYIIEGLARTYHPSFAETERDTAYAEGRRYVGLALVEIINKRAGKDAGREQPD